MNRTSSKPVVVRSNHNNSERGEAKKEVLGEYPTAKEFEAGSPLLIRRTDERYGWYIVAKGKLISRKGRTPMEAWRFARDRIRQSVRAIATQ